MNDDELMPLIGSLLWFTLLRCDVISLPDSQVPIGYSFTFLIYLPSVTFQTLTQSNTVKILKQPQNISRFGKRMNIQ